MTSSTATAPAPVPANETTHGMLVVALANLDVRYASPQAVDWLGMSAERLLGRSLIISQPELGQALTRLIALGLGAQAVPLNVSLSTTAGQTLVISCRQAGSDAVLDLHLAREPAKEADHGASGHTNDCEEREIGALQRRLDQMRQDLAALRRRVPCDEAMARGEDPILFWLWQAEAALAHLGKRCATLNGGRHRTTATFRRHSG